MAHGEVGDGVEGVEVVEVVGFSVFAGVSDDEFADDDGGDDDAAGAAGSSRSPGHDDARSTNPSSSCSRSHRYDAAGDARDDAAATRARAPPVR